MGGWGDRRYRQSRDGVGDSACYIRWGGIVGVEMQHLHPLRHQLGCGIGVELDFSAGRRGVEMEAMGDAARCDAFGDESRFRGEDHGEASLDRGHLETGT